MPIAYSAATKTARMNAVVTAIGANGKLKLFTAADALRATGVTAIAAPGLQVGEHRTRLGRYLLVRLAGGEVAPTRPHQDHGLSATVSTTVGTVEVAIDARVHAR